VLLVEGFGNRVDDIEVEVLAAEIPVAVRRADAEDAVLDLEDRDVERASTDAMRRVRGDAPGGLQL